MMKILFRKEYGLLNRHFSTLNQLFQCLQNPLNLVSGSFGLEVDLVYSVIYQHKKPIITNNKNTICYKTPYTCQKFVILVRPSKTPLWHETLPLAPLRLWD